MSYVRDIDFAKSVDLRLDKIQILLSKRLKNAYDPETRLVDTDHPDVLDYIAERRPKQIEKMTQGGEHLDMTLRDIIERHGSIEAFGNWIKNYRLLMQAENEVVKNEVYRGKLVKRDLVIKGIFTPINTFFSRTLQDSPKNIATQVTSAVQAGSSQEEIEEIIREIISKLIKPAKAAMLRAVNTMGEDDEE